MALKVVKGAYAGTGDREGTFIIQVTNKEGKVGYLCDIDGSACISDIIIPEVVKFKKYSLAKAATTGIKGVQTRIIGEQTIEKILAQQGIKEHEIIPMGAVDKDIYHVLIMDHNTGEKIGYVSMKEGRYVIVNGTEGAAFWDSESAVEGFIQSTVKQMPEGLKLEKSKFN